MTLATEAPTRNAYRAETEPGMAMSMSDLSIIKGVRGVVKIGSTTVSSSTTYKTKAQAMRWAVAEAKRFRDYRQQHGEGIEEVRDRKRKAEAAAVARRRRITERKAEMYDLLIAMASDLELASDVPSQAHGRVAKVKEIVAYVEGQ